MNYGSDPADQIVRFTLEGTEVALKLSGLAAKNFALFVYAVLKDQKKTHGKTRLVRMLREQRPFKFFNLPATHMKDFVREAKEHGLLYVPIRNKQKGDHIELVVFADDATKIQRIYDNLGLDYVKAEAGEATLEKAAEQEQQAPAASAPSRTETVQMENGAVEFEGGGAEMPSISVLPGRVKLEILPLAGNRNSGTQQRKRVRPSLPRPAKTLRPA